MKWPPKSNARGHISHLSCQCSNHTYENLIPLRLTSFATNFHTLTSFFFRFTVLRLPYETGPLSAPLPRKIIRLRQDSWILTYRNRFYNLCRYTLSSFLPQFVPAFSFARLQASPMPTLSHASIFFFFFSLLFPSLRFASKFNFLLLQFLLFVF